MSQASATTQILPGTANVPQDVGIPVASPINKALYIGDLHKDVNEAFLYLILKEIRKKEKLCQSECAEMPLAESHLDMLMLTLKATRMQREPWRV